MSAAALSTPERVAGLVVMDIAPVTYSITDGTNWQDTHKVSWVGWVGDRLGDWMDAAAARTYWKESRHTITQLTYHTHAQALVTYEIAHRT